MSEKESINTRNGWTIFSTCVEDNPHDWRPGKPTRYKASGFAEYTGGPDLNDEFSCKDRQNFPQAGVHHVYLCEDGHEDVRSELRKTIAGLKVE